MNTNRLIRTIEKHEGYRQFPYKCTEGFLTIAIGRNIETKGIRYSEARFMLKNDLEECKDDLREIFKCTFDSYPDYVQEVMMSMRFQLGSGGFRKFKKFIGAIRVWDFEKAADEMLDSLWAKQTPGRAKELSEIMRHGFK